MVNLYVGPPMRPMIVIESVEDKSLTIRWNILTDGDLTCGLVTYHIKLTRGDGSLKERYYTTTAFSYTFRQLSPNTQYTVSAYGSNNAGNGQKAITNVTTSAYSSEFPAACILN